MCSSYDKPDLAKVRQLIAGGINVRFMAGMTALIGACFYNHVEVVRALLEADPSPEHILISNTRMQTAFSYAKSDQIKTLLVRYLREGNVTHVRNGRKVVPLPIDLSRIPDAMYNEMVDIFVQDKEHKLTAKPMLKKLRKQQKKGTPLPEYELSTLWARWRKEAKQGMIMTAPKKR